MKHKTTRTKYRLRNWKQYIAALINRGSLSLCIDRASVARRLNTDPGIRRGRPHLYADAAIECAPLIREVYHLPLRQAQGLIKSLYHLLKIDLPVPHYSTLSRRACLLPIKLRLPAAGRPLHLLIDSTGFKVYGEGEWYVRLRKQFKRRTWRKLHIAVDHRSGLVVSAVGTHKDLLDRDAVAELLDQTEPAIKAVYADGAYDYKVCYKAIFERGGSYHTAETKGCCISRSGWLVAIQT